MKIADILEAHPAQRRLVDASLASLGLTEEAAVVARGERYRPGQVAVACDKALAYVSLDAQTLQASVHVYPWQQVPAPALDVTATLLMERVELAMRLTLADPVIEVRASERADIAALVAFWAACLTSRPSACR
jgi:hypothetical protein